MTALSENNSPIDVYYDMDIAQICQHFNKTRNTVDKAVAKLVKLNPNKGWKYKNPETKRITIKAEGVETLATYFRKEKHEISTIETELRAENEKLTAILQEKDKTIANLEILYNERLKLEVEKSKQTFLLEQKSKDEIIERQTTELSDKDKKISELEDDNQKLSEIQTNAAKQEEQLSKQLEEYKKREEEYNAKSFFYRMTHKFSLS